MEMANILKINFLLVIYQTDEFDTSEIGQLIQEQGLPLEVRTTVQFAAIGELAGVAVEIIEALNSDYLTAVINLNEIIVIGTLLIKTVRKMTKQGKKVKLSEKGVAYSVIAQKKEKIYGNSNFLGTVGPFYIHNPNDTLDKLTDIHISGLDNVSGVLFGLRFKERNYNRISWEIYSNEMKKILSWDTNHAHDEEFTIF